MSHFQLNNSVTLKKSVLLVIVTTIIANRQNHIACIHVIKTCVCSNFSPIQTSSPTVALIRSYVVRPGGNSQFVDFRHVST